MRRDYRNQDDESRVAKANEKYDENIVQII